MPRSQPLSVTELFERQKSRRALLCLFLAILELVKRQAIQLGQKEAFGDIYLKRSPGFDDVVGSDDAIAAAEKEYS